MSPASPGLPAQGPIQALSAWPMGLPNNWVLGLLTHFIGEETGLWGVPALSGLEPTFPDLQIGVVLSILQGEEAWC